jgi:S1 RNA binding domain
MIDRAIQVSTSQRITHIRLQSYRLSAMLILSHISYAVSYACTDRPSARVNPITVSLDDISEQDEVTGTVVRVSNYGVFIDIGAGVDAFLHRRKMKVRMSLYFCCRTAFYSSFFAFRELTDFFTLLHPD